MKAGSNINHKVKIIKSKFTFNGDHVFSINCFIASTFSVGPLLYSVEAESFFYDCLYYKVDSVVKLRIQIKLCSCEGSCALVREACFSISHHA